MMQVIILEKSLSINQFIFQTDHFAQKNVVVSTPGELIHYILEAAGYLVVEAYEVCRMIRSSERLSAITVITLTGKFSTKG
jgi:hypothetical protein